MSKKKTEKNNANREEVSFSFTRLTMFGSHS